MPTHATRGYVDSAVAGVSGGNTSDFYVLASSYSAVGNGTTDDTTALQNALNALNTNGAGYLDLEGKTYATGKLSVKPNTGIINGTLKLKNSANDYIVSLDGHATRYQSNWLLRDLTLDCNLANNLTTAGGVYVYASGTIYDRPLIDNVKIVNVRSKGIAFEGNGTTMTIQPRLFHVTVDGPSATAGSKGIFLSSKVYDPSFISVDVGRCDTGIDIDGAAKIRFTDVRAWGNEAVGLKLNNVVDFVGANCEFDKNFGHGVYTYNSSRVHFSGSAFSNNSYDDTSNEFGLGAGHGTSQVYDGIVGDGASEIYISACRAGNEATAYQRYGISSQGTTTIYYDGTTKFFNNGWGTTTGAVKSGQQIAKLELNNDASINPETATRLNVGFQSNVGVGFELYKYTDATKPGKFATVYGGAAGQGTVGFTHYNGTSFTDRFSLDASGNLTVSGTVNSVNMTTVTTASNTQTLTNKTISGANNTLSNIAVSSLSATGTASSTTYLRGDGTWSTPSGGSSTPTIDTYRTNPVWATDFYDNATAGAAPFFGTAVASGTINSPTTTYVTPNHIGVLRVTSSTTTNSGYFYGADTAALLLGGGEVFEIVFSPVTITNTTHRYGFHDTATSADATDGVYFEIGTTGVLSGKTANNSTRSITGTTYTLTTATWYRARLTINSSTLATFVLYNEAGTQLWTDTLTTNIPTASGRLTGAGCIATNSGTTAVDLAHWDFMAASFGGANGLTR